MGRILSDIKMVITHNAHHHLILAAINISILPLPTQKSRNVHVDDTFSKHPEKKREMTSVEITSMNERLFPVVRNQNIYYI